MGSWVECGCGELVLGRVHVGWELGRDRVLGWVGWELGRNGVLGGVGWKLGEDSGVGWELGRDGVLGGVR